jgi:hypothetical protein
MSRRRRNPDDGPPDPAAALDKLERWIERKLPQPPRPVWADAILIVVRLALGRGSWVVGALFVALGAPWFVYPYRQVESMVRAAWYRQRATETAEAKVERIDVELLPGLSDGTQRVVPRLVLSFDAPGVGPQRVRYWPAGEIYEPFHQWSTSATLMHSPPSLTPAWRFRWSDATSTTPRFDLSWSDAADAWIRVEWNGKTFLARALDDLDRPVDLLVGDWTRPASEGRTVRVRYAPGDPTRVFAGDQLDHLPPTGSNGWGELVGSFILALPFGLPFYWFGTRLLSRGVTPRWRHLFFWVPLALLPFWGTRYLEVLERLSPGALERNSMVARMGSTQVVPDSHPFTERDRPGPARRQALDFTTSRFAPLLRLVDWTPPPTPLADGNAVWRELDRRFSAALDSLDDAAFIALLSSVASAEGWEGAPAVSPVLVAAADRASRDPRRGEEAREWARRLIINVSERAPLGVCHPANDAHEQDLVAASHHPDAEVAKAAATRVQEFSTWKANRLADWHEVCPR